MGFLFSPNVEFTARQPLSPWRRIAIGTWRTVRDPSTYGVIELRADAALNYLRVLNQRTGQRVTITHFAAKAVALALAKHPELNATLRFGAIYQRKHVDIFFQIANDPEGRDLSGGIVRAVEQKSLVEIASALDEQVKTIRTEGDHSAYRVKHLVFARLPGWATAWFLDLIGLVAYKLNLWAPWMGAPRDAFGSLMLTNVGALGISFGFAPLVPYSHCPAVLALGAVEDRPIVVDGELRVGKVLDLCATLDHRIIDGLHASRLASTLKAVFHDPKLYFGEP